MTSGRKTRLYRLVVDTWPTPDGAPFDVQPPEQYARAIDAWSGDAVTEPFPAWMAGIDWSERIRVPGEYEPIPGVWMTTGDVSFTVPVHRRRHFLSPTAARDSLARLQAWGAHGHIETSDPITWKGAP